MIFFALTARKRNGFSGHCEIRPVITEPYTLNPIRRAKHMQRLSWQIAAGLISALMWWLGWAIYQAWSAGIPGFRDIVDFIASRVSGT